jgi:hypothetical protein
MKYILAVILCGLTIQASEQTSDFAKSPFCKEYLQNNIQALNACAQKADIKTGLAAIVHDLHEKGVDAILADADVVKKANWWYIQSGFAVGAMVPTTLQAMVFLNEKLAKKGMISFKTNSEEELHKKLLSTGEEAIRDNIELMQLNEKINPVKFSKPFTAALLVRCYVQEKNKKD